MPEVYECINELMKIKNLILIRGNHDQWFFQYLDGEIKDHWMDDNFRAWQKYGGEETLKQYKSGLITKEQINFLTTSKFYYEFEDCLFVHAGFIPNIPISDQDPVDLMWDRTFIRDAYDNQLRKSMDDKYKEIYVGHTPLLSFHSNKFDSDIPQKWSNVWNMDTGAAFSGVVSLMNIETKEIFLSDKCMKLYPDHLGRNQQTYNSYNKY